MNCHPASDYLPSCRASPLLANKLSIDWVFLAFSLSLSAPKTLCCERVRCIQTAGTQPNHRDPIASVRRPAKTATHVSYLIRLLIYLCYVQAGNW